MERGSRLQLPLFQSRRILGKTKCLAILAGQCLLVLLPRRGEPVKISPQTSATLAILVCAPFFGGCTSDGAGPAKSAGTAAPTTTASMGDAFRDAETVASREGGRVTAKGTGVSMAPVFGDNTLLVINPIRFEELGPGMTVAYVNGKGVRVVHRLVSRTKGGWLAIGINNPRVDEDLVTSENLIGVVYASFHYTDET